MKKIKMNAQDLEKMFSKTVTIDEVVRFTERTGADVILEDGRVGVLVYGERKDF